jgi:hypothetical protein
MIFPTIFITTLAILIFQIESVKFKCFLRDKKLSVCNVYEANFTLSQDDIEVTNIVAKNKDEVIKFVAEGIIMKYFPRGITKFLPNIEVIEVVYSNLQIIVADDLKQFGGKLKIVSFIFKKIKTN